MIVHPAQLKYRVKLTFPGNERDNPIETLINCERQMEQIDYDISDTEKINFVTQHFKDSAAQ